MEFLSKVDVYTRLANNGGKTTQEVMQMITVFFVVWGDGLFDSILNKDKLTKMMQMSVEFIFFK